VRGIAIAHVTDGLRNAGTPMLALPAGYCMVYKSLEYPAISKGSEKRIAQVAVAWKKDHKNEELCSECVKACPTGALQSVGLNQLHLGTAVVYKDYCLAWLYGNCNFACMDACVFNAITMTAGPVVDAEKCVGCNQCSYVCVARLLPGPTGIMVEPTQVKGK
jgi:Fe-S-cluster-containing hydrogenase component 2